MKVLVIVALFAFVAVQVCHSAPIPNDEKVEVPEKKDEPAAAASAADTVVPALAEAPKAESEPKSDAVVPKAADLTPPAAVAEDKKD